METIRPEGFDFFTPQGNDKSIARAGKVLMKHSRHRSAVLSPRHRPVRYTPITLLADIGSSDASTVFSGQTHFELGIASRLRRPCCGREAIGTYAALRHPDPPGLERRRKDGGR